MKSALTLLLAFTLFSSASSADSNQTIDTATINKMTANVRSIAYVKPLEAIDTSHIIISLAKSINYTKGEAEAYNNIGVVYDMLGNRDSALYYFDQSAVLFEKLNDTIMVNGLNLNKANIYLSEGNILEALKLGTSAQDLFDEVGFMRGKIMSRMVIGTAYGYSENYKESIKYFKSALKLAKEEQDDNLIAICNIELGTTFYHMQQQDSAIGYYKVAEKLYHPQDLYSFINLYNYYGEAWYRANNLDSSRYYFEKSLATNAMFGDSQSIANSYVGLCMIYTDRADYPKAKEYGLNALRIIENNQHIYLLENLYHSLYKISLANNNINDADKYINSYIDVKDSIRNKAVYYKTQEFKFTYNLDKAEAENALLTLEKETFKKANILQKVIISLSIVIAIIAIVLTFLINRQRKKEKLINEAQNKLLAIISHDFRSPLTSLKGFISVLKKGAVSKEESNALFNRLEHNLDSTLDLVDNLLYWSKENLNNLEPNLKHFNLDEVINKNIELYEALAGTKGISIVKNTDDDINVIADSEMVHTIIRNLLSNAIKFTESGEIKIRAIKQGDFVNVSVTDTGVGMTAEQQASLFTERQKTARGTRNEKGTGLGLIISYEFVKKHQSLLKVTSEPGKGTTFSFQLTLAV